MYSSAPDLYISYIVDDMSERCPTVVYTGHVSIPCLSCVAMVILPVGDTLEGLLKKDVVKSGDGLSLGLSPHMMKFFTMEGPFIGLCSALLSVCVKNVCTCVVHTSLQIRPNQYCAIYMYMYTCMYVCMHLHSTEV